MRKRVLLLAAPLCVVAIAASVAVASPSDAEHSRGPRLDKLHAVRPTAASSSTASANEVSLASFQADATAIQNYVKTRTVGDYLVMRAVGDYIASRIAAEQAAAEAEAAAPRQVSSSVSSNSNPGDFLSCVRNRESGGNYGIYNSGGSGAAGAYQFLPGTWNSIAASSGRGDLVGVDPAQASPADQDAMAQALYAQQGSAPWGGGC
jgi:muramidase (phage lysozyme)